MRHDPAPAQPGCALRHRFESPFWRRLLLAGVRGIPHSLQRATMPLWAGIFYGLVPKARRTVEANLRRVLGDKPAAEAHADSFRLFVNYAQSIANMYALYLDQRLPVEPRFNGRERLVAARAVGNGMIIVTGHLGYWQLGPFLLERNGFGVPVMAMAEEPNAQTHEFEQQFRKRFRIVYTTGSPFASLELANLLRNSESVAMQLDRHMGGAHVMIPFFGRPAPFPLGPATLARATRAPIVPVFMVRDGEKGFASHVEEPILVERTSDRDGDIRRATTRVVAVYESYVRRFPFQWFNFHDFWAPPQPLAPPPSMATAEAARGTRGE
jgi:KDO2-lipid IV(A) lauroyltransferase